MDKKTKQTYIPPRIEVFEYKPEKGFAQTMRVTNIETISEITDDEGLGDGGENFHGEWY